jgi:hypothetical protein
LTTIIACTTTVHHLHHQHQQLQYKKFLLLMIKQFQVNRHHQLQLQLNEVHLHHLHHLMNRSTTCLLQLLNNQQLV